MSLISSVVCNFTLTFYQLIFVYWGEICSSPLDERKWILCSCARCRSWEAERWTVRYPHLGGCFGLGADGSPCQRADDEEIWGGGGERRGKSQDSSKEEEEKTKATLPTCVCVWMYAIFFGFCLLGNEYKPHQRRPLICLRTWSWARSRGTIKWSIWDNWGGKESSVQVLWINESERQFTTLFVVNVPLPNPPPSPLSLLSWQMQWARTGTGICREHIPNLLFFSRPSNTRISNAACQ